MINCSECGKEVSDKASACPTCGFPVTPVQEASVSPVGFQGHVQEPIYRDTPKASNGWKIFSIVLLVLIFLEHLAVAAILVPVFLQAKIAAKKSATISNVKQVGTGLAIYMSDNDDIFPSSFSTSNELKVSVMPYVKNEAIFTTMNPNSGELVPNSQLQKVSSTSINNVRDTVAINETNAWPDGTKCYGFADTHAKFLSSEHGITFDPTK
ncbi:MAG: zinc ribbon domain-containing protein [Armatimonadota bacterium]